MSASTTSLSQLRDLCREKLRSTVSTSMLQSGQGANMVIDLLIGNALGVDRATIMTKGDASVKRDQIDQILAMTERIANGEPVQYVIGQVEFYGMTLKVDRSVLIPRPETEELISMIAHESVSPEKILDIGTGSGCIALALKKEFPLAEVNGIDISSKALDVAKMNAIQNKLIVGFERLDVLKDDLPWMGLDLIVSNPPYITKAEMGNLAPHVVHHEPHLALFTEGDPLLFYRRIASLAQSALHSQGMLYFEIHQEHADQVVDIVRKKGFEQVAAKKDMSGNDRFVKAVSP